MLIIVYFDMSIDRFVTSANKLYKACLFKSITLLWHAGSLIQLFILFVNCTFKMSMNKTIWIWNYPSVVVFQLNASVRWHVKRTHILLEHSFPQRTQCLFRYYWSTLKYFVWMYCMIILLKVSFRIARHINRAPLSNFV